MMNLFKTPFEGFLPSDFQSYTQDKWASRLHNRARMSICDKLSALGRVVQERLGEASEEFSCETNNPIPSIFNNHAVDAQWLFLTRNNDARKSLSTIIDREHSIQDNIRDAAHYKRHLMLAVKVHEGGVDVMMGIHRHAWVDARNATRKLSDEWEANEFNKLLVAALETPAHELHLVGPAGVKGIGESTHADFQEQFGALDAENEWFIVGRNFETSDESLGDKAFADHVAEIFLGLLPVYRFLLWSPDNDYLALNAEIGAKKALNERGGVEIEPGTEVRITSGLFSGRDGVVQELDKKGMLKINVGKLVIQVKSTAVQMKN